MVAKQQQVGKSILLHNLSITEAKIIALVYRAAKQTQVNFYKQNLNWALACLLFNYFQCLPICFVVNKCLSNTVDLKNRSLRSQVQL